MSNKYTSQRIEAYLKGELPKDELREFDHSLKIDETLVEEVTLEKNAQDLVKLLGRSHLKTRLNGFEEQVSKSVKIVPLFKRISAAAAVVLIIVLAVFLVSDFENTTLSSGDLFEQNFEIYRAPVTIRSGKNDNNKLWTSASESYSNNDFKKAASQFQQYLNQVAPDFYLGHFYYGNSLLAQENGDPKKAIEAFEKVIETDNDYKQQAKWYIALAYLKIEDKNAASTVLEEIARSNSYKKEEAIAILSRLKKD